MIEHRFANRSRFMGRRLFSPAIVGLVGVLAGAADAAQSVTVAWDPSPDPNVIGYNLYYGTVSQDYSKVVNTGKATSTTVSDLATGQTYYFAVTAYNQLYIESARSAEIAHTVTAPIVALLRLVQSAVGAPPHLLLSVSTNHPYQVQASRDLRFWTTIHTNISLSTNWTEWIDPQAGSLSNRFYRLLVD